MSQVYRVLDANYNRCIEGLRVLEEVCRFCLQNSHFVTLQRDLRHKVKEAVFKLSNMPVDGILQRDINSDAGKEHQFRVDYPKRDIWDIFLANGSRVKEALRVLEEFSKLIDKSKSLEFKQIRYDFYELEHKLTCELYTNKDKKAVFQFNGGIS